MSGGSMTWSSTEMRMCCRSRGVGSGSSAIPVDYRRFALTVNAICAKTAKYAGRGRQGTGEVVFAALKVRHRTQSHILGQQYIPCPGWGRARAYGPPAHMLGAAARRDHARHSGGTRQERRMTPAIVRLTSEALRPGRTAECAERR